MIPRTWHILESRKQLRFLMIRTLGLEFSHLPDLMTIPKESEYRMTLLPLVRSHQAHSSSVFKPGLHQRCVQKARYLFRQEARGVSVSKVDSYALVSAFASALTPACCPSSP